MVQVKICGITSLADALLAAAAGAEMLGFNFYPRSPRYVDPRLVREILRELSPVFQVVPVGVFVNENAETIREIAEMSGVRMVQLHGEESPEFCRELGLRVIKALRIAAAEDAEKAASYTVDALLVDSKTPVFGGSGVRPDWVLAEKIARRFPRVILAGGLNPDNVAAAIAAVRPWGVDAASGVEREPGVKDPELVRRFISAATSV
jgi:phosphoribosylanthranilate isomerase